MAEQPLQSFTSEGVTRNPNNSNKLFVGQVPSQTTEDMIRQIFGQYGTVIEITILKDRLTGNHKGCAFVTFTEQKDAELAIEATNDKIKLPGANRELIVRFAGTAEKKANIGTPVEPTDNKLYVGMLSRKSTEEDVRKIFEPYGDVTEVHLMTHKDTGASKGAAFVKFASRDEALRAIRALNEAFKDKDANGPLQVRFAQTKQEKQVQKIGDPISFMIAAQSSPALFGAAGLGLGGSALWNSPFGSNLVANSGLGGANAAGLGLGGGLGSLAGLGASAGGAGGLGGLGSQVPTWLQSNQSASKEVRGPPGANLFVYNIPDAYGDSELALLFSNFGAILSATVQVDKTTGKKKGFGFVSYHDPNCANQAIANMDGFMLEGRRLNVRLKTSKVSGGTGVKNAYAPY